MPKIETSDDAIKYLELSVKVEGWTDPKLSASWQILQVIKSQEDVLAKARIRSRLVVELIEQVYSPAWIEKNNEYQRDRETVLGWAKALSSMEESEMRDLAEELAKEWLSDDENKDPLPLLYAWKRSKGERA